MIIQAELRRKQSEYEGEACSVDKVIELPAQRFKQFSRALLADYDFIAENKNAIRHDEDARHCLLILDAEGTDGFLIDPQGYNYARYSAFVPNARSLLTPDMGIDRSYLSPAEPWRDESRDEMLRMTLRVDGKPGYTLVLPADEEYLNAVKAYLDIDVFADAMLCDIRFKVPYIGELIRDTDCPAVEDYNDFAEALEDIWQKDGMLLTYAAVLEAEKPETLHRACELLQDLDNYPETRRQMDSWLEESNSKNRNEFVEKALRFYMGYLGTENITEYLSDALVATLRGIIADSTNRTNGILFKCAVEQGIMAHTIAAHFRDTLEDRRALRGYVVDEVKRTNGQIRFEDAQDVQRQLPDDAWRD